MKWTQEHRSKRQIRMIAIHHSVSDWKTTSVADVRKWHTNPPPGPGETPGPEHGRGWSDIGYNVLVAYHREDGPDGWQVEFGRPETRIGAHTPRYNSSAIGICILGNYDRAIEYAPEQYVEPEAWALLVGTCVAYCRKYGLTAQDVFGHWETQDAGTTKCPGRNVPLKQLREEIRQILAGERPDPTTKEDT